jgi:hypothetical protein
MMIMKKTTALFFAGAAVVITGYLLYTSRRRKVRHQRAKQVSDEGYETAHDVLFPGKTKSGKLQYGPVIPR